MDGVLHAQHLHVGAQRHLAHAVGVEVELVLHEVVEVPHRRQQDLQRLRTAEAPSQTLGFVSICAKIFPWPLWAKV